MSTAAWILVCSLLVTAAVSVIFFVVCATVCTEKKKKGKPVYDVLSGVVTKHILPQYTKHVSDGISKNFKDNAKFEEKEGSCLEHLLESDTCTKSENTFKVKESLDIVKVSHVDEREGEDLLTYQSSEVPEKETEACEVLSSNIIQKKNESPFEPRISIVRPVKAARICKEEENKHLKVVFSPKSKESFRLTAANEITLYPIERDIIGASGGSSSRIQQEDRRSNERLNWDQIFSFLAEHMPPRNYFIFFIHLYDNGRLEGYVGAPTHNIVAQLDNDLKGMETRTYLVRHFQEWKQRLGNKARMSHIIKALRSMEYNDVVERLEDFLSSLPLLPEQNSNLERPSDDLPLPSPSSAVPFCNMQMQEQMFQQYRQIESYGDGKKMLLRQSQESKCTSVSSSLSVGGTTCNDPEHQPVSQMQSIRRGKRLWSETDSSSECETEYMRSKSRRISPTGRRYGRSKSKSSKQIRSNYPNKCNRLVSWKDVTYLNYIKLLKKVMSTCKTVEANDYNLFMQHTVKMILTKNREKSEEEVLSVTCDEFDQYEEKHSKSGEVKYEIDTRFGFLILGVEEWDYLKIYKQQRDKICQERMSDESAFVSSMYVFIGYDGQPVKNQNQTENEKRTGNGEIEEGSSVQIEDINSKVPAEFPLQIEENSADSGRHSNQQAKEILNVEIKYGETTLQSEVLNAANKDKVQENGDYCSQILGI